MLASTCPACAGRPWSAAGAPPSPAAQPCAGRPAQRPRDRDARPPAAPEVCSTWRPSDTASSGRPRCRSAEPPGAPRAVLPILRPRASPAAVRTRRRCRRRVVSSTGPGADGCVDRRPRAPAGMPAAPLGSGPWRRGLLAIRLGVRSLSILREDGSGVRKRASRLAAVSVEKGRRVKRRNLSVLANIRRYDGRATRATASPRHRLAVCGLAGAVHCVKQRSYIASSISSGIGHDLRQATPK